MFAVPISLLVSVIISLFGVLPSAFVTAANLLYFGFWQGLMLSFLGEALGAGVAFYVYRLRSPAGRTVDSIPVHLEVA